MTGCVHQCASHAFTFLTNHVGTTSEKLPHDEASGPTCLREQNPALYSEAKACEGPAAGFKVSSGALFAYLLSTASGLHSLYVSTSSSVEGKAVERQVSPCGPWHDGTMGIYTYTSYALFGRLLRRTLQNVTLGTGAVAGYKDSGLKFGGLRFSCLVCQVSIGCNR